MDAGEIVIHGGAALGNSIQKCNHVALGYFFRLALTPDRQNVLAKLALILSNTALARPGPIRLGRMQTRSSP